LGGQVEAAQYGVYSGKNLAFARCAAYFKEACKTAPAPGSACGLYEHIIFVDEAGGECYGRTKFQQSVNQFSGDVMARKLTKSNAHFQRAVKRLPLGVASNFRYWGEERTIY